MKEIAVLGLGRFGRSLATSLMELGHDVMGVDQDEGIVEEMAPLLTNCVQADFKDERTLISLGLRNFDVVVISTGVLQAAIVAIMHLKEIGVKNIVAKATSDLNAKILSRIGADRVIFPERDMGVRLARGIANSFILDYIMISNKHGMLEMKTPRIWVGKSIRQTDARAKYGVNIVALIRKGEMTVTPLPDEVLIEDDAIVVIGSNEQINVLSDL
jgi:trk system potassium uptake protein TrkA